MMAKLTYEPHLFHEFRRLFMLLEAHEISAKSLADELREPYPANSVVEHVGERLFFHLRAGIELSFDDDEEIEDESMPEGDPNA